MYENSKENWRFKLGPERLDWMNVLGAYHLAKTTAKFLSEFNILAIYRKFLSESVYFHQLLLFSYSEIVFHLLIINNLC